ncbi:E2/UBC family protein [Clostridium arbusti]|uniref:E2/UBC family protein n=1 Tax=Clostridium arbusti TaxID=1137848 RepID=UPI0002897D27|nr:E2/UBC family protein [Clostridium arbusti]
MPLLPNDKDFLDNHNLDYELHELPGETLLVIKDYQLSSMFNTEKTKVLIKIPNGYPMANLDMFWVYPHIKLRETNQYPQAADQFQNYLNVSWQRFSRHYAWKPTYNLSKHLNVIKDVLVNGRG